MIPGKVSRAEIFFIFFKKSIDKKYKYGIIIVGKAK